MPILGRNTNKDWQRYGREDPYYGVVSDDRFHKANLTEEARNAFFRTGDEHAAFLMSEIRNHMAPDFAPRRMLDFGCGVGRCTIPFARHCQSAVGVDISDAMVEEARRGASAMGVENVRFAVSDDKLSALEGETFDFIHSFIVFQHIPFKKGERLIKRLIALLDADGVAALHFLYHAELSPLQTVARWLRKNLAPVHWMANLIDHKPLRYPLMEKNVYDLNRLFLLLRRQGCGHGMVRLEGVQKMHGIIVFFRKHADVIPYNVL